MPGPKRKLDKVARKTIVAAQRSAQGARENIYRLRSIIELAMEADGVEASIVAQAEQAHVSLNTAEASLEQAVRFFAEVPVMEDYADA